MAGLKIPETWQGDIPYFLIIVEAMWATLEDAVEPLQRHTVIDLDERGWATTHADLMRAEGSWYLARKEDMAVVFGMKVVAGEQPYYTRKVQRVAAIGSGEALAEIAVYGIGKKRVDGHVDRMWVLPSGLVCGGDDAVLFGREVMESNA